MILTDAMIPSSLEFAPFQSQVFSGTSFRLLEILATQFVYLILDLVTIQNYYSLSARVVDFISALFQLVSLDDFLRNPKSYTPPNPDSQFCYFDFVSVYSNSFLFHYYLFSNF